MSAPMKMPLIKNEIRIEINEKKPRLFLVPREHAKGVAKLLENFEVKEETVPWEKIGKELVEKIGSGGVALKGARTKEGYTQAKLAEQLKITQHEISEMEHGKRAIGKKMAIRLSKALKIDYRVFL